MNADGGVVAPKKHLWYDYTLGVAYLHVGLGIPPGRDEVIGLARVIDPDCRAVYLFEDGFVIALWQNTPFGWTQVI